MNIRDILINRILILDGAMGTMIQGYNLEEDDFRGQRFKDHPKLLKGDNDLLCLTKPEINKQIHEAYFDAVADIADNNTSNSTSIALTNYGLEHNLH